MNNHPVISKAHLRVSVPVTTNGVLLKYDGNGQPVFAIKHLPLSAEKRLVQRNRRLPKHLVLKIERVDPTQVTTKPFISSEDIAQVQQGSEAIKNKGGRPKKQTLDNE